MCFTTGRSRLGEIASPLLRTLLVAALSFAVKVPGPLCLPFVGSLASLAWLDRGLLSQPHRALHRLAERHGPVIRLFLGDQEWFVISGLQEVETTLHSIHLGTFELDSGVHSHS